MHMFLNSNFGHFCLFCFLLESIYIRKCKYMYYSCTRGYLYFDLKPIISRNSKWPTSDEDLTIIPHTTNNIIYIIGAYMHRYINNQRVA